MADRSARTSRSYQSYPRIVGETGGKDFIFAHRQRRRRRAGRRRIVRGAFEYQGQKCSAASRAYIPSIALAAESRQRLVEADRRASRWATSADFRNFMGAVIDEAAFETIKGYIDFAKQSDATPRSSPAAAATTAKGYFIQPTVIETTRPGLPD